MKVIFLKNVRDVAEAGEIKEVANGYGRNYLLPKGLAVLARPGTVSAVATRIKAQQPSEEEIQGIAQQLEGKELSFKAKVGKGDRLHGAITSTDIADALEAETGLIIDKRKIELAEPIRHLGSFEATIRLGQQITPQIKIMVVPEEKAAPEAAAAAEEKSEPSLDIAAEEKPAPEAATDTEEETEPSAE